MLDLNSPIVKQLKSLARRKKTFDLISADPPWYYNDKANAGNRGAAHKYKGGSMKTEDICALGEYIAPLCKPNCTLLIWGTWPLENDCRRVIHYWGFKKKSCAFVWVKLNKKTRSLFYGMGGYTRSNTEYVLVATIGKCLPRYDKGVQQVIVDHVREHSRKPDIYFDRVDDLYGTEIDRLELFGRGKRRGWIVLGDETDKFEAA